MPIYADLDRVLTLAVKHWGTPEYYVLDSAGTLRFRRSALKDVAAQLAVLEQVQDK